MVAFFDPAAKIAYSLQASPFEKGFQNERRIYRPAGI